MSHISSISIQIKDLAALKQAASRMGAIFIENQKTYNWWGISVGDSPIPDGMTKEMLGKCDHVIKIPGVNYEVGVVKMPNGSYTLAWDEYNYGCGPNGIKADGGKLIEKFGVKLKNLTQAYATCVASAALRAKGWMVREQRLPNGTIQVVGSKP